MKMSTDEVRQILEKIPSFSPEQLRDAASRLYEHKVASGVPNAIDTSKVVGAQADIVHLDATTVLSWMGDDQDHSSEKNEPALAQNSGCLGMFLGAKNEASPRKRPRPVADFASLMSTVLFELSKRFTTGEPFARLASMFEVSEEELADEWHELFFAIARSASVTANLGKPHRLYNGVMFFWQVVYPAQFRINYDPADKDLAASQYGREFQGQAPIKKSAIGAAMVFTRRLNLLPDIGCSPAVIKLVAALIVKYHEKLCDVFAQTNAHLYKTYGG